MRRERPPRGRALQAAAGEVAERGGGGSFPSVRPLGAGPAGGCGAGGSCALFLAPRNLSGAAARPGRIPAPSTSLGTRGGGGEERRRSGAGPGRAGRELSGRAELTEVVVAARWRAGSPRGRGRHAPRLAPRTARPRGCGGAPAPAGCKGSRRCAGCRGVGVGLRGGAALPRRCGAEGRGQGDPRALFQHCCSCSSGPLSGQGVVCARGEPVAQCLEAMINGPP